MEKQTHLSSEQAPKRTPLSLAGLSHSTIKDPFFWVLRYLGFPQPGPYDNASFLWGREGGAGIVTMVKAKLCR